VNPNAKVCVTDLDGTLLHSNRKLSDANRRTLEELGSMGILRVLATGRSLWSLKRVISESDPFDYVIFATGAGIMHWPSQELIFASDIHPPEIKRVYALLEELDLDYMLHHPVPDTHFMDYRDKHGGVDFWERISYYKAFAKELEPAAIPDYKAATQFLAIADPRREDIYLKIKQELSPMTVIRTTSPIDLASLWIEIFAEGVNKGSSLSWLLQRFESTHHDCMVIGNDFNDLDMLELVHHSYVTNNSAQYLLDRYRPVAHHDEDGFSEAVMHWLKTH
jgi:Cof subfamily protein (haloacid dehalogenase superfamily)